MPVIRSVRVFDLDGRLMRTMPLEMAVRIVESGAAVFSNEKRSSIRYQESSSPKPFGVPKISVRKVKFHDPVGRKHEYYEHSPLFERQGVITNAAV